MKSLSLLGVMLLCCIFCFHSEAQLTPPIRQFLPTKSTLFSRLPEKFIINNSLIEKLFTGPAIGPVKIFLADNIFFEGIIMEKVQKNENVICINIKSSNYDGALLTLSKISYNDNSVTYTGRIVSMQHGDVLMLKKENSLFFFTKQKQSLVMVE